MKYPKNMLIQTVKGNVNGKIQPIGVFVGINDVGCVRVGWSKCRLPPSIIPEKYLVKMRSEYIEAYKKELVNSDKFDLDRGIAEALKHIMVPSKVPVGRNFEKKFKAFEQRCRYYFKDAICVQLDNGQIVPRSSVVQPKPITDFGTRRRSDAGKAMGLGGSSGCHCGICQPKDSPALEKATQAIFESIFGSVESPVKFFDMFPPVVQGKDATGKSMVMPATPTETAPALKTFEFAAMNSHGHEIKGSVVAKDRIEAIQKIKKEGKFPVKVEETVTGVKQQKRHNYRVKGKFAKSPVK